MRTNLIVTLVMVIAMLTLVGCESSANVSKEPAQAETKQEVTEETTTLVEAEEETVAKVEEEVSDVTTEEPVVEVESTPEPEVETYETVFDWAMVEDASIPKLGIWNEITKQVYLLENEGKYVVKEGDRLVLFASYKEKMSVLSDIPCINKVSGTTIYDEYEFTEYPMEPTVLDFAPRIDGVDYELSITVVSEQAGESAFLPEDGENEEVTETGEEWANTLSFEEPKLLVWNDETGTREVIDSNGEYTLKDGDGIALYTPEKYEFDFAGASDGCGFLDALYEGQVAKIGYKLPEESMKVVVNHYMLDAEGGEIVASYTIITP